MFPSAFRLALLPLFAAAVSVQAAVVFNEIHYHPVENPVFTGDGRPVLDLSEDVHEFIEL